MRAPRDWAWGGGGIRVGAFLQCKALRYVVWWAPDAYSPSPPGAGKADADAPRDTGSSGPDYSSLLQFSPPSLQGLAPIQGLGPSPEYT